MNIVMFATISEIDKINNDTIDLSSDLSGMSSA